MKRIRLEKSLCIGLCILGVNTFAQKKVEFRSLTQLGTSVNGILDSGAAILTANEYDYITNTFVPKPASIKSYVSMNDNGDVLANGTVNNLAQPVFRLNGTTEWVATNLPTTAKPYAISNNGLYIVGQNSASPSSAFMYDVKKNEFINLSGSQYKFGAAYAVNNDGIAVGWVDKGEGSTKRELAVMKPNSPIKIILAAQTGMGTQEIRGISDDGIVSGNVSGKPFIYNINTDEYKIFDLPVGYRSGILGYTSNGISVGFVQNSPADRDAIIYHESLSKPKRISELLEEEGVDLSAMPRFIGSGLVISKNGDFVGGVENGGAIAYGWILKLNGYFDKKACNISAPVDVEAFLEPGQTTAKVDYVVTSDCPTNKLVLVKGLASGSNFPAGITSVVYNLVNEKDEVIDTKMFKVYVQDFFCTPSYTDGTEPITRVKFGDLDNRSSVSIKEKQNEYFFDNIVDIVKGKTYEISVEGNTNGSQTDQIAVYFDWDQNNSFNPDVEGYFVGKITNSTGEDGQAAKMNIPIPDTAKEGIIRMRVMKAFKVEPNNPCAINYAYGQVENYYINIVKENLGTDDVISKEIKIFPNPVKNILNIQSNAKIQNVKIMNTSGQIVINTSGDKINVQSLAKGVYIIEITSTNGTIVKKVIKN
ncbi:GEVED domain-containing protein [Empedobacter brevis]|uniref:T9SS type A sorting domain-containing protein n=1 Tax=Empedobacter brevis TaxID=247 RepID=UPI002FE047FC